MRAMTDVSKVEYMYNAIVVCAVMWWPFSLESQTQLSGLGLFGCSL